MKNRINYIFLLSFGFLSNCFGNFDSVTVNANDKGNELCSVNNEFLANKELRDNFYSDEVFYDFAMVTNVVRKVIESEGESNRYKILPAMSENNISDNLFDNFMYLFPVCEVEPFSVLCEEDFIKNKNSEYKEYTLKNFFKLTDDDADNKLNHFQNVPLEVDGYFASDLKNVFSKNTINACRLFALQKEIISNWISIYKTAYLKAVKSGLDINKKVDEKKIDEIIDFNCDIVEKRLEKELNEISKDFLKHFKVRDFIPHMKDLERGIAYFLGGLILSK